MTIVEKNLLTLFHCMSKQAQMWLVAKAVELAEDLPITDHVDNELH